jgi:hypothetical protein
MVTCASSTTWSTYLCFLIFMSLGTYAATPFQTLKESLANIVVHGQESRTTGTLLGSIINILWSKILPSFPLNSLSEVRYETISEWTQTKQNRSTLIWTTSHGTIYQFQRCIYLDKIEINLPYFAKLNRAIATAIINNDGENTN